MNPSVLNRTAIAAALFVASGTLAFADTATTDPVGFFTKTLAASGGSARLSSTVSFPLYRPPVYTAAATAVGASTVDLNGGNFGTGGGQTDVLTNAHLVRVKAATDTTHVGRFYLVTAQSGTQLTVSSSSLTSFISVGDTCEVLPANTLANLFGDPPPTGWLKSTAANGADNVVIWNGSTWLTYFYHSVANRWQRTGASGSQNNTIIYPDEGVFVSRLGTSAVDLVFTGTVPTTAEKSDVDASASTFISNRFPVDITLLDLGLHLLPDWVKNTSANGADKAYLWNTVTSTWDIYFYHSVANRWQKSGASGSQNSTNIPAGTAVFVTRISGASVNTLAQSLPYTP